MGTRIRVLILADRMMLREGLTHLLQEQPGIEVVGATGEPQAAPALCRRRRADVVLVDVDASADPAQVTRGIHQVCPGGGVIVFAPGEEPLFVERAFGAGASGVYVMTRGSDELIDLIASVAVGETVVSAVEAGDAQPAAGRHAGAKEAAEDRLTARELQVLEGAASGRSTKEVAEDLSLSVQTVQSYLKIIFAKLDVHSKIEAIVVGMRLGLVGGRAEDVGSAGRTEKGVRSTTTRATQK